MSLVWWQVTVMALPVRDPSDPTLPKPLDGKVTSRNPWAEAFKTLEADEQKQFNQTGTDPLGVLAEVSGGPM